MAVKQLRDFLETGANVNSGNFPQCKMDQAIPAGGTRLCISHKNIPNMVGQITTALAESSLNISTMTSQSRGDFAYTLIDVDTAADGASMYKLGAIKGLIAVRTIAG